MAEKMHRRSSCGLGYRRWHGAMVNFYPVAPEPPLARTQRGAGDGPSLTSLPGPEAFPHFPEVAGGSTWAAAMADTDPAAAVAPVRFKSK